ncbi:NADH dehydrogenase [ubiquinone] 1 alpha subcomplex assembly factor 2-like isoform X2 [Durio zibethinus]|uniref:NADH dehydrogenase [ubiquinone] 1 alpha subcomplex subunit 12 n=1 Tax=Durio zibethinus TaxID=66656 RepID=A0A6P5ZJN7_DURZI|nr:NADH dehydrogenase [ubiquinone] 1 alpha subcomplex assembly factor 2-like isoform X2 [Durio zibethinus]
MSFELLCASATFNLQCRKSLIELTKSQKSAALEPEMSKLFARIAGFFSDRTFIGVDKAGNRYFTRKEEIDVKEKRWVEFKREQDPTFIPVEWICWLNGQRKIAPTLEEIMELEARREHVRLNVAFLKREEEERKVREGSKKAMSFGPDLKSFFRQFPSSLEGDKVEQARDGRTKETREEKGKPVPESSEPTGSGASYKPGTWQPST